MVSEAAVCRPGIAWLCRGREVVVWADLPIGGPEPSSGAEGTSIRTPCWRESRRPSSRPAFRGVRHDVLVVHVWLELDGFRRIPGAQGGYAADGEHALPRLVLRDNQGESCCLIQKCSRGGRALPHLVAVGTGIVTVHTSKPLTDKIFTEVRCQFRNRAEAGTSGDSRCFFWGQQRNQTAIEHGA